MLVSMFVAFQREIYRQSYKYGLLLLANFQNVNLNEIKDCFDDKGICNSPAKASGMELLTKVYVIIMDARRILSDPTLTSLGKECLC